MTGDGIDEFFEAVEEKRQEFERDYKPELERKKKEREDAKAARREQELGKLMKDMNVSGASRSSQKARDEAETVSEAEDDALDSRDTIGAADAADDDSGDDYDTSGTGGNEGLSQRYQQALAGSASQDEKDHSFTRYLRASNINR
jgi:hypothetical protein